LLLLHEEGKICRGESLFWPLQLVIKSAQGLSNTGLQGRRPVAERANRVGSLAAARRRGSAGCGSWTVDV
jgi:hypothetical protein